MSRIWLISDLHFSHRGVCNFLRDDGTPLRPWNDPEEMDEALIENFNNLVSPNDKTYFLGDMVINRRALPQIGKLNGDKILIKGNHDIFRLNEYTEYFRDIRAYHVHPKSNVIMSHIPIHASSKRRFRANIHGHTHANFVLGLDGLPDPWYINVCVENTNFRPILFDEVLSNINPIVKE